MVKEPIFILSFLFFIFLSPSNVQSFTFPLQELQNLKMDSKLMFIFIKISDFLGKKFNSSLLDDNTYYGQECLNYLVNLYLTKNTSTSILTTAFDYSGKYLGDFGFENECTANTNYTFFLLQYQLNISDFNQTDQYYIMRFLNQTSFYTGFCMFDQCIPFIYNIFNSSINQIFSDYLKETAGITKHSLLFPDSIRKKIKIPCNQIEECKDPNTTNMTCHLCFTAEKNLEGSHNDTKFYALAVMFIISGVYFGFVILCSIMRIIAFFKFEFKKETYEKIANDNSFEENFTSSMVSENDSSSIEKVKQGDVFTNLQTVFAGKEKQKEKTINKCILKTYEIIKHFDCFSNLSKLSSLSNYYYNDKGIESLSLIRLIVMLSITLFNNVNVLFWIPPKDMFNHYFYSSYSLFIIKLSVYCISIWIILDGIITSFKLMSYIKSYMTFKGEASFMVYFKFFMLCVPKMIVFLYIYFFIYFLGKEWNNSDLVFFGAEGLLYKYSFDKVLSKSCTDDCYKIIAPFVYDFTSDIISPSFSTCYLFTYVMFNEFCCFIVLLLIFYFSFKLKSKLFDSIVFSTILVNSFIWPLIFKHIFFNESIKSILFDHLTLGVFGGENYSIKFPFIMINYYMIGVFLGLCYYYYNQSVVNAGIIHSNEYSPFQICYNYIKKIHAYKIQYFVWVLIFLLVLFAGLIISNFSIKVRPLPSYYYLIFSYEKIFVAIIFFGVSSCLIAYPKETAFKQLIKTNIFIIFERINTSYFCITQWLIYAIYSEFRFQLNLSYQNLIYVSVGITIINILISIVITICIEIPLRKMMKFFLREVTWEENNRERIEEDLGFQSESTSRSSSIDVKKDN